MRHHLPHLPRLLLLVRPAPPRPPRPAAPRADAPRADAPPDAPRAARSRSDGVYATAEAVGEAYLQNLAATRTSDRGSGAATTHLLDRLEIPKKARKA